MQMDRTDVRRPARSVVIELRTVVLPDLSLIGKSERSLCDIKQGCQCFLDVTRLALGVGAIASMSP